MDGRTEKERDKSRATPIQNWFQRLISLLPCCLVALRIQQSNTTTLETEWRRFSGDLVKNNKKQQCTKKTNEKWEETSRCHISRISGPIKLRGASWANIGFFYNIHLHLHFFEYSRWRVQSTLFRIVWRPILQFFGNLFLAPWYISGRHNARFHLFWAACAFS